MTVNKISVSLPDDVVEELDARTDNRSAEIVRTLRRWWAIEESSREALADTFGDSLSLALAAVRATGVARPEAPVLVYAEEFGELVACGCRLAGLDEAATRAIVEAAARLDYAGRVMLVLEAGR